MNDEQQIDAQILDMAGLGAERGQAERRVRGPEQAAGMGFERQDGQGRPAGLRNIGSGADHDPVAPVQSIEITQRNHGTARIVGQICEVSE